MTNQHIHLLLNVANSLHNRVKKLEMNGAGSGNGAFYVDLNIPPRRSVAELHRIQTSDGSNNVQVVDKFASLNDVLKVLVKSGLDPSITLEMKQFCEQCPPNGDFVRLSILNQDSFSEVYIIKWASIIVNKAKNLHLFVELRIFCRHTPAAVTFIANYEATIKVGPNTVEIMTPVFRRCDKASESEMFLSMWGLRHVMDMVRNKGGARINDVKQIWEDEVVMSNQ